MSLDLPLKFYHYVSTQKFHFYQHTFLPTNLILFISETYRNCKTTPGYDFTTEDQTTNSTRGGGASAL